MCAESFWSGEVWEGGKETRYHMQFLFILSCSFRVLILFRRIFSETVSVVSESFSDLARGLGKEGLVNAFSGIAFASRLW